MSEPAPKKLFIKTYGCQMNVYDSDRMADALAPHGYEPTLDVAEADLVVLNTCHIREKASEKVFSELGRLNILRQQRRNAGGDLMIGVAGCVAQAEGEEIIARAPAVDLVFGPQAYHRLPELLERSANERVIDTDFPQEDKFAHLPAPKRETTIARGLTAFLTVQEGCDKFCSFCVVPYTRGAEVSRPVAQVLAEARRLAEAGVREITLLGQNVNAYHGLDEDGDPIGLGALLYRLAEIEGLDRLRYTTSHPRDMDDGLIAAHRDLDQLMPYLHLPVQSGSDRILKAMNRQHTADDYLRLIDRIKVGAPRHRAVGRFHRRLSRRDRRRFRRDAEACRAGGLCVGLLVQIFAAAGHAGGIAWQSGRRGGEKRAAAAVAGADPSGPGRFQCVLRGPRAAGTSGKARTESGSAQWPLALSAGGASGRAIVPDWHNPAGRGRFGG